MDWWLSFCLAKIISSLNEKKIRNKFSQRLKKWCIIHRLFFELNSWITFSIFHLQCTVCYAFFNFYKCTHRSVKIFLEFEFFISERKKMAWKGKNKNKNLVQLTFVSAHLLFEGNILFEFYTKRKRFFSPNYSPSFYEILFGLESCSFFHLPTFTRTSQSEEFSPKIWYFTFGWRLARG